MSCKDNILIIYHPLFLCEEMMIVFLFFQVVFVFIAFIAKEQL